MITVMPSRGFHILGKALNIGLPLVWEIIFQLLNVLFPEEDILIPLEKGMRVINTSEGLMREDFVFGNVFGKPIRGIIATTPLRQHRPKIEPFIRSKYQYQ